ncbi:MAG: FAD-binding oxidoreductase [Flavobacteriales bacterium]|nr:FAD-binding oxidoreductase [Flavobacteriales bacterium]
MQTFDFIVTGAGLAGSSIAYQLVKRGYTVLRVTSSARPASMAAYGILNPIHIRNVQLTWKASEIYPQAVLFYQELKSVLKINFFKETEIYHLLGSKDEAVYWRQQAETGMLGNFCTGDVENISGMLMNATHGCIKITGALYVDIPFMLQHLHQWLAENKSPLLVLEAEEQKWSYHASNVQMNEYEARFVIHCEGVAATNHPLWKNIPFRPCKGEVLTLQFNAPIPHVIVHKKIFLIPLSDGTCKAGSTYVWDDLTSTPTPEGAAEILQNVKQITRSSFIVKEHVAGVRPAVADRRPVVGLHPTVSSAAILNGYGSKGLILNPFACNALLEHLLNKTPVPVEIDVHRFNKRLQQ